MTNRNKCLLTGMWSGAALPFQFADNSGECFNIELILMITVMAFVLENAFLKELFIQMY